MNMNTHTHTNLDGTVHDHADGASNHTHTEPTGKLISVWSRLHSLLNITSIGTSVSVGATEASDNHDHDHDHAHEEGESAHDHAAEVAGESAHDHSAEVAGEAAHDHSAEGAAADEHAGHSHGISCDMEPIENYNMPLRIGSVFIIMVTSAVGKFESMHTHENRCDPKYLYCVSS